MKKEMNLKESYRRLRVLLALPGPMVLLVTLLFWSLGGGGGSAAGAEPGKKEGLNTQVPAPVKEGKPADKSALYKISMMDSMRKAQQEKGAAAVLAARDSAGALVSAGGGTGVNPKRDVAGALLANGVASKPSPADSNERRAMAQLADLKAKLNASPGRSRWEDQRGNISPGTGTEWSRSRSVDMDRMERLLHSLKESGSAGSPEMQELNRTLDKLIAVQQPARRPVAVGGGVDSGGVAFRVVPVGKEEAVSGLQASEPAHNRFYDLESNDGEERPTGTAMEAIVPETQTLVSGATLRMELTTELVIHGQRVAKGTTLYGTVRMSNDRLLVTVGSIRSGGAVFPVALRVLDQDGLAGIYSPGSATRDVSRESAGEVAGSVGPAGIDATPGGQALSAGIQLARNLARRRVQLARVTVKAGYRVFLQDESKGH